MARSHLALQSLITLLSSIAYYDQLARFEDNTVTAQTFFVVANVPVSARGFIVVAVTVGAHLILAGVILAIFLKETRLSGDRGHLERFRHR